MIYLKMFRQIDKQIKSVYWQYLKPHQKDFFVAAAFVTLFFVTLINRLSISVFFGDDAWFASCLNQDLPVPTALLHYLIYRYANWSSRLLIETVLIFLSKHPMLWRVLDAGMMTLMACCIYELTSTKKTAVFAWFVTVCIFLLPKELFYSAGWIATTTNYSWPLALGLLALIPVRKLLLGEKPYRFSCFFSLPALLYAANHEQMCAILFGLLIVFLIYALYKQKTAVRFISIQLTIVVVSLAFIAVCPGNSVRFASETSTWFPLFSQLSILKKAEIGISSTGFILVMQENWLFTLFCALIFIMVFLQKKEVFLRLLAVFPLLSSLIWGLLAEPLQHYFPHLIALRDRMTQLGTINDFRLISFVPDLILISAFGCIVLSLFFSNNIPWKKWLFIWILLLSVGSRVIIGFSPTIWASGERTAMFMYVGLIVLCVMIAQEIDTVLPRKSLMRKIPLFLFAIYGILFAVESILG